MEDSKARKKLTDLGRLIVRELKLEPGVDTLSKWMSHYVAEKILLIEKLKGNKRKEAQKECFETILKLWENRWYSNKGRGFLENYEALFVTLDELNPDKNRTFYRLNRFKMFFDKEKLKSGNSQQTDEFKIAILIDKIARHLILEILNEASIKISNKNRKTKLISLATDVFDYPETNIIRFVTDVEKPPSTEDEKKERIVKLQKKIKEIQTFNSVRKKLVTKYKNEISKLKANR